MKLFLHRVNCPEGIRRANRLGVGAEVDVRTVGGVPVLSHDAVTTEECLTLEEAAFRIEGPIILDFKETGIVIAVQRALCKADVNPDRVFATDLIVPDMLAAEKLGIRTLARTSQYENITGPFYGHWLDYVSLPEHLEFRPNTFVVSPELHKCELEDAFIVRCKELGFEGACTDFPEAWL